MNFIGIIAEFNPFHNGHAYLLDEGAKRFPDHARVVIMSGNFTQRGDICCLDKFTRARHAVLAGADLVVELPAAHTLSSAESFAAGAVSRLACIDGFDTLLFGSESGSIEAIANLRAALKSIDATSLQPHLDLGKSYPRAMNDALKSIDPEAEKVYSGSPNNLLAAEYLHALETLPHVTPVSIKRAGAQYNDTSLHLQFASASALRDALYAGNFSAVKTHVPDFCLQDLHGVKNNDERLFTLFKYTLSRMSAAELRRLPDLSEGLENRILSVVSASADYASLLFNIKSKRYTMARIKRILLNALVGNTLTRNELLAPPAYLRVLAVRKSSVGLLSQIKVPAIKGFWDTPSSPQDLFAIDRTADLVYESVSGKKLTHSMCVVDR